MIPKWLLAFSLCFVVSACGFQLRGTGVNSLKNHKISIVSESPYGEIERALKRSLRTSGAELISNSGKDLQENSQAAADEIFVVIQNVDIQQLGASRDATGRANEVILLAVLDYQISQQQNKDAIEAKEKSGQLKVRRSYFQDYLNPVSEQTLRHDTQKQIFEELAARLANQIAWTANQ